MTHYRSHQMRAFKASASAGNVIIVLSGDVQCDLVTAVEACEVAGTCEVVYVAPKSSNQIPWRVFSPTSLTPGEQRSMFPVIPSKPPLNRADRRALKFKKGNR